MGNSLARIQLIRDLPKVCSFRLGCQLLGVTWPDLGYEFSCGLRDVLNGK